MPSSQLWALLTHQHVVPENQGSGGAPCSVCNCFARLVFAAVCSFCSQGLGHSTVISLTLLPSHLIPICYQIEFPVPSLTFKPSGGLAPSAWLARKPQVGWQWPIKCALRLALAPGPPSRGAARLGYTPQPFFLFWTHNSRPIGKTWLKTELVFCPLSCCFSSFLSEQSSQGMVESSAAVWLV